MGDFNRDVLNFERSKFRYDLLLALQKAAISFPQWISQAQRAYVEIMSTGEVWRARKRSKSCSRGSREQL